MNVRTHTVIHALRRVKWNTINSSLCVCDGFCSIAGHMVHMCMMFWLCSPISEVVWFLILSPHMEHIAIFIVSASRFNFLLSQYSFTHVCSPDEGEKATTTTEHFIPLPHVNGIFCMCLTTAYFKPNLSNAQRTNTLNSLETMAR